MDPFSGPEKMEKTVSHKVVLPCTFSPTIILLQVLLLSPKLFWADIACTGDNLRAAYSLGATDCVSGLPPLRQLFYSGLAGPRYLLEKNI